MLTLSSSYSASHVINNLAALQPNTNGATNIFGMPIAPVGGSNLFGNPNGYTTNPTSNAGAAPSANTANPASLTGTANANTTGGLFGAANPNTTGGLFGTANTNTTGGLFGNADTNTTGGLFGNGGFFGNVGTTGGNLFGNPNTNGGGLFGDQAPLCKGKEKLGSWLLDLSNAGLWPLSTQIYSSSHTDLLDELSSIKDSNPPSPFRGGLFGSGPKCECRTCGASLSKLMSDLSRESARDIKPLCLVCVENGKFTKDEGNCASENHVMEV